MTVYKKNLPNLLYRSSRKLASDKFQILISAICSFTIFSGLK